MQFQVPQNIAIEDKIVGPLTAIQFGIVVIGGGAAFLISTSASLPSPINQIAGGLLALFTAALAIGKFNDQPLYRFIRHIIFFLSRPRVRIWHKTGADIQLIRPTTHQDDHKKPTQTKRVSKQDIAGLAVLLDSRGASGTSPHLPKSQINGNFHS